MPRPQQKTAPSPPPRFLPPARRASAPPPFRSYAAADRDRVRAAWPSEYRRKGRRCHSRRCAPAYRHGPRRLVEDNASLLLSIVVQRGARIRRKFRLDRERFKFKLPLLRNGLQKLAIGIFVHQAVEFRCIAQLDFENPALAGRILVTSPGESVSALLTSTTS